MAENVIEFLIKGDSSGAARAFLSLDSAAGTLVKGLGALGVGLSAIEFGKFIGRQIEVADQFGKMSQRTGVATDVLSQMSHAFSLADVDMESMGASLKFLNKAMAEAGSGNKEAIATFQAVGLSVKDLSTIKADEALLRIADAFSKAEDGANKTALSLKLFSRAGEGMIPGLNQGRAGIEQLMHKADQLGLTVGSRFAAEAERFNDSLKVMQGAIDGAGRATAAALLPVLNATIDALGEVFTTGESAIPWSKVMTYAVGAVAAVFTSLVGGAKILYTTIAGVFNSTGTLIGGIAAAMAQVLEGDFSGAASTVKDAWNDANKSMAQAMEDVIAINAKTNEGVAKIIESLDEVSKTTDKVTAANQRANQNKLKIVDTRAAEELEKLHKKQMDFLDALAKANAHAANNKMAQLDAQYSHESRKLEELKFEGEARVQAQHALDKWYAAERVNIQNEMIDKLGIADANYRQRKADEIAQDAERMQQAGIDQASIDQYQKTALLEQQLQFLQAKRSLIDEDYLSYQEVAMMRHEEEMAQLQLAYEQKFMTKEQFDARLQESELKKQAALGSIQARAELNRLQVSRMSLDAQLAYTSQSLGFITQLMSSENEKQFKVGKAAAIAQAVINTYTAAINAYQSAAAIPFVGWILGPVAAAAALAMGMAQVSKIKSTQMSGQAHAGMTNVPNEGTFLLDKGERVISPEQNKDLTGFLENGGGGGGKDGFYIENLVIHVLENATNADALLKMSDVEMRQVIADKMIPGLNILNKQGIRPDFVQRLAR